MEVLLPAASIATAGPEPAWLALGPASRLVGVDPDTLRRWADTGRVRAFSTPGGHRRFARTDLVRLREAGRAGRRSLAVMGATPERVSRAYGRSYRDGTEARIAAAEPADRQAFRRDGRELVAILLEFLDTSNAERRSELERRASAMVGSTARRLSDGGVPIAAAIEGFVAGRQPLLTALASLGRRQMLSAPAVALLYSEAAELLDRLLLRFIAAYQSSQLGEP
jgi:excisionase family DNA binding protein